MGRDTTLETEALTGLGMLVGGNNRKVSRFTALEKGLLASLALALILILVLVSVIVLVSFTTVREERKIESQLSEVLRQNQNRQNSVNIDGNAVADILPPSEEEFASDMSENDRQVFKEFLNDEMARKTLAKERAFARRFPRDQYRSSAAANTRRLIHNLPRPLKQVSDQEIALTPSEKIAEIMYSLDDDSDMSSDPWELHNWIVWVESIFHQHTLEEQWSGFGRNETANTLTWSDYQSMLHPYGASTNLAQKSMVKDRRRWENADADSNEELTKHEFRYFIFPQMSPNAGAVLIPEAHDDLDTNFDGKVGLQEFLDAHRDEDGPAQLLTVEEKYFNNTLDADKSGFLDVEEIVPWVQPEGFVQAKSEVIYLMEILDKDGDKLLTRKEIIANPKVFLSSQATYFGQIYKLQNLRDEVFQLKNNKQRRSGGK